MKLNLYKGSHSHIGTEWEHIENIWILQIEDTDTYDTKTKDRFAQIEIIQTQYLYRNKDLMTWYKGTRTCTFDKDTKDKQKLLIIEEVNKFLRNFRSHALVAQWSEQSAHN